MKGPGEAAFAVALRSRRRSAHNSAALHLSLGGCLGLAAVRIHTPEDRRVMSRGRTLNPSVPFDAVGASMPGGGAASCDRAVAMSPSRDKMAHPLTFCQKKQICCTVSRFTGIT